MNCHFLFIWYLHEDNLDWDGVRNQKRHGIATETSKFLCDLFDQTSGRTLKFILWLTIPSWKLKYLLYEQSCPLSYRGLHLPWSFSGSPISHMPSRNLKHMPDVCADIARRTCLRHVVGMCASSEIASCIRIYGYLSAGDFHTSSVRVLITLWVPLW